jgi:hypothetical protein
VIELAGQIWYFNDIKAWQLTALSPVVLVIMWNPALFNDLIFVVRCRGDKLGLWKATSDITFIGRADMEH